MLKITKRLRRHAVKHFKAADTSTDQEIRKLYSERLMKGAITVAGIREIEAGTAPAPAPTPAKKKKSAAPAPTPAAAPDVSKLIEKGIADALRAHGVIDRPGDVSPSAAFTKTTRIRVKEASERYSRTKTGAVYPAFSRSTNTPHPMAGQPVRLGVDNQTFDHPSDLDKAVALAFVKYQANKNPEGGGELPRWLRMTDHDRELLLYAAHEEKWTGCIETANGNETYLQRQKLDSWHIKTLLDDTNSGGIEITPVVFDDALVLTPVLYGELFPFVNVQTVSKGRRVKGGAMVNPEFTSGTGEGTAIMPFSTSNFVSAFDTPIHPAVAAIEIGQDFDDDSPVDLGGQVVEQFGLKAMEWLDRVIAVGNGTSEPLGIFNTTACTVLGSTNGSGGPYTVSDYEGLMFGVNKEYRTEGGAFMAYLANDFTYRKARAIRVGPGDERRVFGMSHSNYTLLDTPFKVQNNIPDGYSAYANLRRYQMYRRLGMQVKVETGGRQLVLNNTRLLVVRMRYGGQLNRGGAACLMRDGQYY